MTCCGRAVFEAGNEKETVDFSTIADLRDAEDELTWKHFPTELNCISIDIKPAVSAAIKKAA